MSLNYVVIVKNGDRSKLIISTPPDQMGCRPIAGTAKRNSIVFVTVDSGQLLMKPDANDGLRGMKSLSRDDLMKYINPRMRCFLVEAETNHGFKGINIQAMTEEEAIESAKDHLESLIDCRGIVIIRSRELSLETFIEHCLQPRNVEWDAIHGKANSGT